ncbi:MAG: multiheme c-type cytochrome [Gemmataceae bacterium]
MRQTGSILTLAALGILAAILGRGGSNTFAQREDIPPPTPLVASPSSSTFQYQGVASCASAACHHGNGPSGTKGSEYTTWIAQKDPHSRAYTVLFDRRSLLIERNLKGLPDLKQAQPHKDMLCLRCHVNPDVETAAHHERFSFADGVGCESCHGAAEKWLNVHFTNPWRNKSAEEKQREGMTNTKDIGERAQVCVRCHVGRQEADVNHDLIAAGHPRLRFEYGAYLANYPARHWKLADDHARYGDFEARAWLVGQAASAKAALELLSYRAEPKHDKPWPEFAEYGCFSCHHDLQDQEWRRKPFVGQLPWGTWYFAQRKIVAGTLSSSPIADNELFHSLSLIMAGNDANQRKQVSVEAANTAKALDRWMSDLKHEVWDEKSLKRLLASLAKEDPKNRETDWDRTAQRYLGIAAVYNALSDMDANYRQDFGLKTRLHCLADLLIKAVPKDPGVRYDSPREFDPKLIGEQLKDLRKQLQRRGVE